jgi:hypothetical protein
MDNPIVNWVIPLHDVPPDLDGRPVLLSDETETRIEREQSGQHYLHSSKFRGLSAAQIDTVAAELIAKINGNLRASVTMGIPIGIRADESQVTRVTSISSTPVEIMATVSGEGRIGIEIIVVDNVRDLIAAIRTGSPEITYHKPTLPTWLPWVLVWAFLFVFTQSAIAYVYFVAREALSRGYDVELTVRAMKPSVTLRATNPKGGDVPPRSGVDGGRKNGR